MIITLTISLILGVFLSLFVLRPLFSAHKKILLSPLSPTLNGSKQLQHTQGLLFSKLVLGSCSDNQINSMSEEQAFNLLYTVCEKLESLGLSWKQNLSEVKLQNKESGNSPLRFIFVLLASLTAILCAQHYSLKTFASPLNTQPTSSEVTIPPPFILPTTGDWIPSVNQFILIPAQGALQVYYVGMFSNSFQAKSTKLLLPFPKNITNVSLRSKETATLENTNQQNNGAIVLNTPLNEGINQIQAEFNLPASAGKVSWKKNSLDVLPGVTIVIMPEYDGAMRNLFSYLSPSLNIWPARTINFPQDFKSLLSTSVLTTESNTNNQGGELSRQFVRVGSPSSPFPEFDIVGIVPSRFFLYLLVSFFACFFIAALIISILKSSS